MKTDTTDAPTRLRVSFEVTLPEGVLAAHVRAVYVELRRWLPWKTSAWRMDFVR